MEECVRRKLDGSMRQVRGNTGIAGVDRMTVDPTCRLSEGITGRHSGAIVERLYRTEPVRRWKSEPDG